MIDNGLYQALVLDATVASFLPDPANNVYFIRMEKDTIVPAIVIQGVSKSSINTLLGESELQIKHYQFDCYASRHLTAAAMAQAVKAVFIPRSDGVGFPQFPYTLPDGTEIQSAMIHLDNDWPFEEGEGGYVYRHLLDIEFGFIEVS